MALITRISRLFKADFHAVLDQIEEPEQVLKQAIREMEEELTASERLVRLATVDLEALDARGTSLREIVDEVDGELDLCFAEEKEDLAKVLVKKKLATQRLLKHLAAKQVEDEKHLAEIKGYHDENSTTLENLRQKAELVVARAPRPSGSVETGDFGWAARQFDISSDEIEVAFLGEKRRREKSLGEKKGGHSS